ncbi:MAG: GNAT family N-acetyltransferase [Chloroflexota bacterium]|nr:GNAT family N-acetyltransferase [Chloroflexota bacterium]
MTDASLRDVDLAGRAFLDTATELLLRARGDDPMVGIYEAGDVQWWWKDEAGHASTRHTFWLDAKGQPVAALLVAETAPAAGEPGRVDADLFWRPSRDALVRERVLPAALDRLAARSRASAWPVSTYVDERDADLRRRLEATGFRRAPGDDMLQLAQRPDRPPEPFPLPSGMSFADDRARPADRPHHLAKRNGERVANRLRECSLYRPDLDLCVRTDDGEVAAYCLCWLDPGNRVGLFEPVRTEDAYQRRGIGWALMVEGIRRLIARGANLIKVSSAMGNEAAKGLYRGVGFVDAFAMLCYVGPTGGERSR